MFGHLAQATQPGPAAPELLAGLEQALSGQPLVPVRQPAPTSTPAEPAEPETRSAGIDDINWEALHAALTGIAPASPSPAPAPATISASAQLQAASPEAPRPGAPTHAEAHAASRAAPPPQNLQKETTIRIDTARLDQVLNLSGEIGLTKNRIANLKSQIIHGKNDQDTLKALDLAVNQLDLLVSDLQNAVMKTRMQPIGRLFQKYPRLARDLARQLGKDVELVLSGEETELDKTMIEDLNDPLVHLVRNAVDHGIETNEERAAANKPPKALVTLSASQVGDHIIIRISDDGRGMRPDTIRRKAMEKGLIDVETANGLDDRQSLQLIFMPGFTTKDQISNISGRGVGMDVVKTNIAKLNGKIDVDSVPGQGKIGRAHV
jgi:two-component system chemotaxis sensor kinase CheA